MLNVGNDGLPATSLMGALKEWWADQRGRSSFLLTLRVLLSELWLFVLDSTPERRRQRYGDVEYDWDWRVDTTGATVGWRERLLGMLHSAYQPTDPALFHAMVQNLPIEFSQFTFIDLGSGKGRTLLMASDYPFRRIVGVELLPQLAQIARENVERYQSAARKCFALEVICGDAREFDFPSEPSVIYLFNPFTETGFCKLIERMEDSLRADPRMVYVLYHNPLHERVLAECGALRRIAGTHQYAVYASTHPTLQTNPAQGRARRPEKA
jgi:SAM-dependent methyltransferase